MKTALLFDNFGPYHLARLEAANQKFETVGVEFSKYSAEYPWLRSQSPIPRIHSLDSPKKSTAFAKELFATLDSLNPDVVAIPGWSDRGALLAVKWTLKNNRPLVLMSESCQHDFRRIGWKEIPKKTVTRLCGSGLVGGTNHKAYLKELGMPEDCVFFGYDAVDNDYFSSAVPLTPPSERAFLASARFVPKKNLFRLLRAFHLFQNNRKARNEASWTLTLLGDGPLKTDLLGLVKESGLEESVFFPGFRQYPDLPFFYAQASAFIHASTVEQWGLVVNEAMAAGLPVLVSNRCGCAADLIIKGRNGYSFDPYDESAITEAMEAICLADPSKRKAMGKASKDIISNWGLESFATGLKAATERTLENQPKRTRLRDQAMLSALTFVCRWL